MAQRKKDTTTATAKGIVVNQLVIKTLNRPTQTIDGWRTALKSADNGRLTLLYNMYKDILTDNVLKNAIGKRIRPITNAGLTFTINNEEVPEINDLIKTKAFRMLLKEIMLAKMWGITVLEPSFDNLFDVFSIPRTHINTKNKVVGINEGDDTGISYVDDPFLIAIEGEETFGEILAACPYVIYKRGNFGDWAQFAELFGMPFRLGKYDSFDEAGRIQLTEALDKAGSAAYAAVPKNTDLEYIANNSTGDGALYDNLRKACNEEILIGILGQTMTTVQGDKGARSLGEVHQEVEGGIHADDRIFVETILNTQVRPRLEARGFKVSGGTFTYPELGETISLKDRITIDKELDGIVEIEPDYFYETYGIPKPKDGGGKKVNSDQSQQQPKPTDPPKLPKEKVKLNDDDGAIELRDQKHFWKGLANFFVSASGSGAMFSKITLSDEPVSNIINIDRLVNQAIRNIYKAQTGSDNIAGINNKLFKLTNTVLRQASDVTFSAAGVDWGKKNTDFTQQFRENTSVFSAFKSHEQTDRIVASMYREDGSIRPFSEFKKEALKISEEYNKNWLQTEYNTAIRAARMAVNWKKFQETKHLYPNLEYVPSRAATPRDAHRLYWGCIFSINDPIWDEILPPSEWGCLCGVKQTDKEVTAQPSDWVPPVTDPVFRNNPGKTAKIVNTEETGYYKNSPEDMRVEIIKYAIDKA